MTREVQFDERSRAKDQKKKTIPNAKGREENLVFPHSIYLLSVYHFY